MSTRPLIALCASWCLLASCETPSRRSPDVHAVRPPPEACAKVADEPRLPDTAGLVKPVTDAEKAAFTAFMTWAAQHTDWGRALAARARKTVAWCEKQG